MIWSPVVEPEIPGVERFLTAQPVDLIRTKKFYHVPVISGITKDEFASAPLSKITHIRFISDFLIPSTKN